MGTAIQYVYLLDTTYACGMIEIDRSGTIIAAAPIYQRFVGKRMWWLIKRLKEANQFNRLAVLSEQPGSNSEPQDKEEQHED